MTAIGVLEKLAVQTILDSPLAWGLAFSKD
jgi:hypothetical protein